MIGAVGLDLEEIDVDDDPGGRRGFLENEDLAQVIGLDGIGLAFQDGVELGLQNVEVDPARLLELARSVLAELADVEDDPGEVRMGVVAEVRDLGAVVPRGLRRERKDAGGDDESDETADYLRDSIRLSNCSADPPDIVHLRRRIS